MVKATLAAIGFALKSLQTGVSYTITGTFDLDPDDLDAHPQRLAEHLIVDLDLGDNLVAGSHTEQVTVTNVQRVDPDHE